MDAIQQKHNQMNNEIMKRNIPSQPLQPYFNIPSISTKYVVQPTYDFTNPPCVPTTKIQTHSTYDTQSYFYPGNRKAPFSGFSTNINVESELRNQHIKLSKNDNNVFVPTSNSSLYHLSFETSNQQTKNINPNYLLFQDYNKLCQAQSTPTCSLNKGDCIFFNNTRLNK